MRHHNFLLRPTKYFLYHKWNPRFDVLFIGITDSVMYKVLLP